MSAKANSHVMPRAPSRSGATKDCAKIMPSATKLKMRAVPRAMSRPITEPTARKPIDRPTRNIVWPKRSWCWHVPARRVPA